MVVCPHLDVSKDLLEYFSGPQISTVIGVLEPSTKWQRITQYELKLVHPI